MQREIKLLRGQTQRRRRIRARKRQRLSRPIAIRFRPRHGMSQRPRSHDSIRHVKIVGIARLLLQIVDNSRLYPFVSGGIRIHSFVEDRAGIHERQLTGQREIDDQHQDDRDGGAGDHSPRPEHDRQADHDQDCNRATGG